MGQSARTCFSALNPPTRCTHATGVYSKTVNLPQTAFDMRANSVVREPQLQQWWADNKIYEQLSRSNSGVSRTATGGRRVLCLMWLDWLLLVAPDASWQEVAAPLCQAPRLTTSAVMPAPAHLLCLPNACAAHLHAARRPAVRQRRPAHRPRAEQDFEGHHQPLPAAAGVGAGGAAPVGQSALSQWAMVTCCGLTGTLHAVTAACDSRRAPAW